jgi:hypothetical protein
MILLQGLLKAYETCTLFVATVLKSHRLLHIHTGVQWVQIASAPFASTTFTDAEHHL